MESKINQQLLKTFNVTLNDCSKEQLFTALMLLTKQESKEVKKNKGNKKVYYISAEFLIGKLLSNNLINLGIYDDVRNVLKKYQFDLSEIEELELEPSLGNGGLGRLAACFLDSIATLGYPGDGIGLNYHLGLFKQELKDLKQKAIANPWIEKISWLERQKEQFQVPFKDFTLTSTLYDIDVIGYESGCNKLHLFDLDSIDEGIVSKDGISFDKKDIEKNLTLFLYPDDSDEDGKKLRLYQQYFMVSNAAQLILKEFEEQGYDLHELNEHVVIQINDTHPSLIIPELIRLLIEKGIEKDEAIEIVSKTCAYTNHTILSEALEKWPLAYLEEIVPHLVDLIKELDEKVKVKYGKDVAIIDEYNQVHMAHMDIHYGFSVNGVAALHTEILKNSELNHFYKIYPEKFNNKTNGITFRRWLLHCNEELSKYLDYLIGSDYKHDATKLEQLLKYRKDIKVLKHLETIKQNKKQEFNKYLQKQQGISVNVNSIFDVQVKRLHEYKRQQMNALYAIYKYLDIKKGNIPSTPITMIFGAKAAPAYTIAQDIIHLICALQKLIENDPQVAPYFQIVMLENYNVSYAEKVIPAADISEQISLASKEASGTGNMKFMLNGAITLGTLDGANVEISNLVEEENIYIFGKRADEVIELYQKQGYSAKTLYEQNPLVKQLVDFIVSDELLAIGDQTALSRLYYEILNKDWFMTLLDLKEYIDVKEKVYQDYEDFESWYEKSLVNIAKAGFFSSDRTIKQYNDDIWKLK